MRARTVSLLTSYNILIEQWSRTFFPLAPLWVRSARQVSFEEAFTYCKRPEVMSVLEAYGSLL